MPRTVNFFKLSPPFHQLVILLARAIARDRCPQCQHRTRSCSSPDHIIGCKGICDFLYLIHQAYEQVHKIYVIWENGPIHAQKKVFETLKLLPRIELVWLLTYAAWLNPIEKLWHEFRQDILYLHRLTDN